MCSNFKLSFTEQKNKQKLLSLLNSLKDLVCMVEIPQINGLAPTDLGCYPDLTRKFSHTMNTGIAILLFAAPFKMKFH
jgi:hypothetical protein